MGNPLTALKNWFRRLRDGWKRPRYRPELHYMRGHPSGVAPPDAGDRRKTPDSAKR